MTKAETWGADVSVPIHKQLHFCLDGVRLTEVIVKAASFELLATVPIRAAAIRAATIRTTTVRPTARSCVATAGYFAENIVVHPLILSQLTFSLHIGVRSLECFTLLDLMRDCY
jgi:hypothetical protein